MRWNKFSNRFRIESTTFHVLVSACFFIHTAECTKKHVRESLPLIRTNAAFSIQNETHTQKWEGDCFTFSMYVSARRCILLETQCLHSCTHYEHTYAMPATIVAEGDQHILICVQCTVHVYIHAVHTRTNTSTIAFTSQHRTANTKSKVNNEYFIVLAYTHKKVYQYIYDGIVIHQHHLKKFPMHNAIAQPDQTKQNKTKDG